MSKYPYSLTQNPAPVTESGLEFQRQKQALTNEIVRSYMNNLASNYVSEVTGPAYTLQFQAIAEQLAGLQIAAQEAHKDLDWDFTRPDFLFSVLGTVVFPDATERSGWPVLGGDVVYRDFLVRMVDLLLRGATKDAVEHGVSLVSGAPSQIVERYLSSQERDPTGKWTLDNQFEFDVFLEGEAALQGDLFTNEDNIRLVIQALKAAHAIYQISYVFRDGWENGLMDDTDGMSWALSSHYYDDWRVSCDGLYRLQGEGDTLEDRTLFRDVSLSFSSVSPGASLEVVSGSNQGTYTVLHVLSFFQDDPVPRNFTTSPTNLSGTATISGRDMVSSVDLSTIAEGEVIEFLSGPNKGVYRAEALLGNGGGVLGIHPMTGPLHMLRVSPTLLRVDRRMPEPGEAQAYTLTLDRLGVKKSQSVVSEDVSDQLVL